MVQVIVTNATGGAATLSGWIGFILATEYGDANLDGEVLLIDLAILGQNYNQPAGWTGGDFGGDGQASLSDLDFLGQHYGFGA